MRRFGLALLLVPGFASADIHYTLAPTPASKSVTVTITPDQPREAETFRIPAWCPGFYTLKSYQNKISDVRASASDGTPLTVEKADSRGWRVLNPDKKKITLSYKVLGDDPGLGFFGVNVRDDKAFVNGPAAFMYVDGRLTEPTTLRLKLPNENWQVATGATANEQGVLTAGGYDEMIDHPLQLGAMTKRTFQIGNYEFEAVFVAPDNRIAPSLDSQVDTLRRVAAPPITMFGGAPFKRYVFLIHLALGDFGGGLEHRASTTIAMPNDANLDLTTLAAHEFFHTWNVKNMRPKVLGPFDYTQQVRTGNLWFAEGVTDYYAQLNAYRSGKRDAQWLVNTMTEQVTELQSSANRRTISLEDASKKTWESSGFGYGDLSYYNKGLVAGLILDASIRSATKGEKSLDDVMRLMYERYRLPKPGYDEDTIRLTINEVAGKDLSAVYNRTIRSTQEVPYEALEGMGLRVLAPGMEYLDAGFTTTGSLVHSVSDGAYEAGLRRDDEIVGATLSAKTVELKVRRDDGEFAMAVPLSRERSKEWTVEENPLATASQRKILAAWFKR